MSNIKANIKVKTDTDYNQIYLSSVADLIGYENIYVEGITNVNQALDTLIANMRLSNDNSNTTVFGSDGSITQTYDNGKKIATTFNTDGSITEALTYTDVNGVIKIKTKTTTFNSDGSINEVIS